MDETDEWVHPTSEKRVKKRFYEPGTLLRCVGPWFHDADPMQGHNVYEMFTRPPIPVNGVILSEMPPTRGIGYPKQVPQGYPMLYLGEWNDQHSVVYTEWGPKAISKYSVVDDQTFWEMVEDGTIDRTTCIGGSFAYREHHDNQ